MLCSRQDGFVHEQPPVLFEGGQGWGFPQHEVGWKIGSLLIINPTAYLSLGIIITITKTVRPKHHTQLVLYFINHPKSFHARIWERSIAILSTRAAISIHRPSLASRNWRRRARLAFAIYRRLMHQTRYIYLPFLSRSTFVSTRTYNTS